MMVLWSENPKWKHLSFQTNWYLITPTTLFVTQPNRSLIERSCLSFSLYSISILGLKWLFGENYSCLFWENKEKSKRKKKTRTIFIYHSVHPKWGKCGRSKHPSFQYFKKPSKFIAVFFFSSFVSLNHWVFDTHQTIIKMSLPYAQLCLIVRKDYFMIFVSVSAR